jgi:metallo-beta-lactamase class B
MIRSRCLAALLATGCACSSLTVAQNKPDTVNAHLTAAAKAAGFDHIGIYNTTCARLGDPSGGRAAPLEHDRDPSVWAAPPAKVFDNLYWLGEHAAYESHPSAWAVNTSEGIIVIDALHTNSVEQQVVGGLRKLGLDPKRIKYVLVTHSHGDHFGGAKYLQDTFGAHVMMSAADWDVLDRQRADAEDVKPKRDMVVTDGQAFTLGDTTLTMYITPGHTAGTVSFLLPVKDRGVPHLAVMWGGTGWTFGGASATDERKLAVFTLYHGSAVRFRDIVAKAHPDVVLGNHSYLDLAEEKNAVLAKRGANDPNPWIMGADRALAYLDVAVECSAAGMASFR